MYNVHNNAGELISRHDTLREAKAAADKRTEQLCGARHYVWDYNGDFVTYETKPAAR